VKQRISATFFVLLWAIAVAGSGCYERRDGSLGLALDIHSQDYHDRHYGRHDRYDHWGPDGQWNDRGHWEHDRWSDGEGR